MKQSELRAIIREEISRLTSPSRSKQLAENIHYLATNTGIRLGALEDFAYSNNIDTDKLATDLNKGRIERYEITTAVVGKPNNKYYRALVGKYSRAQKLSPSQAKSYESIVHSLYIELDIPKADTKRFLDAHKLDYERISDDLRSWTTPFAYDIERAILKRDAKETRAIVKHYGR